MIEIHDFPKLECVFERQIIDGVYQVIPKIREEYRWVFSDKCLATTKLDGTNVSILIQDGVITGVWNRTERIPFFNKNKRFIIEGLLESFDRGYMEFLSDGQNWGELIGEKVNGNPYKIKGNLWVPFARLKEKSYFKFWNDIVKDCEGKSDEEIFSIVSDVFKGLWCIYKRQLGITGEVNENVGFEGLASEGIVFYNKETGAICKCRRDCFSWFRGRRHNSDVFTEDKK